MANTPLRILKSTRENWSENLSDQTIENHPILTLLKSKSRIEYNCSGTDLKWTVEYKEAPLVPYADFDVLTFNRQDLLQTATLDTRGYQAVDAISNKEMKQNKGKFAIIKLFDGKAMRMKKTAGNRLCAKFYIDGNLAGNEKDIHGIESFTGITPGSQVATDDEATVYNDTYAGLSTTKGAYGGAQGERHFDFWTPTVVNCNKTGTSWATDADAFLRYAITKHTRGQKADERLDLIQLTRSAYVALCQILESKERVVVNKEDVGIRKFGFKSTMNFDGVDVTFDPDIPATDVNNDVVYGYGFTTEQMKLKSLDSELWESHDLFDIDQLAFKWTVGFTGNLVFESPRHFVKFAAIS